MNQAPMETLAVKGWDVQPIGLLPNTMTLILPDDEKAAIDAVADQLQRGFEYVITAPDGTQLVCGFRSWWGNYARFHVKASHSDDRVSLFIFVRDIPNLVRQS